MPGDTPGTTFLPAKMVSCLTEFFASTPVCAKSPDIDVKNAALNLISKSNISLFFPVYI